MFPDGPSLESLLAERGVQWKLNEDRLVREYRDRPQEILVSVVMPTWNRASVIRRAIDSVLRQSYLRLELLVADDGSRDGTRALLDRHYGSEPRLRYLAGEHAGVSRARNRALEAARGELIAYLDTDDAWSEHFLLVSVNALVDRPGVESVYSGTRIIDSRKGGERLFLRAYERERLLRGNYIFLQTFVHARTLFERLGGLRDELRALEDWELVLRYTRKKAPVVLECCLFDYYIESGHHRLTDTEDLEHWHEVVRRMHQDEISAGIPASRGPAREEGE